MNIAEGTSYLGGPTELSVSTELSGPTDLNEIEGLNGMV
jgi:hypothetical protein